MVWGKYGWNGRCCDADKLGYRNVVGSLCVVGIVLKNGRWVLGAGRGVSGFKATSERRDGGEGCGARAREKFCDT